MFTSPKLIVSKGYKCFVFYYYVVTSLKLKLFYPKGFFDKINQPENCSALMENNLEKWIKGFNETKSSAHSSGQFYTSL